LISVSKKAEQVHCGCVLDIIKEVLQKSKRWGVKSML
jgi:hypothetical protein